MENWVIKNKKADFSEIAEACGISEVLARCLVNRGLEEPKDIETFLYTDIAKLHDPWLMKDMDKACCIITDKINSRKKIRIIGDYDVDGVISTYILYRTLLMLDAVVDYRIPDRIKDGYGINLNMVREAREDGIDTILTCDNGIVAVEQVEMAKGYGMTVIITDHHSLAQIDDNITLPKADAIINPKQPDCQYPFKELCGAAIAYKLLQALMSRHDISKNYIEELISYIAIATVCDVMELIDENRYIVRHGLKLLADTDNKGLLALMDVAGVDKKQLNTYHLGYVIGPSLNASGRLDTAEKGMELLMADTVEAALRLAHEVRALNELRKDMTVENVDKAICKIEEGQLYNKKVIVVYIEDCHESIAGIIAGKVKDRYNRPTIILTDSNDGIKGSARSIEQYNMIEELLKCRELFNKVGGHPMAAGLSLPIDNIEALDMALNENAMLTDDMLIPKVTIDIQLPFRFITMELVEELKLLEPFGKGNEKPLFAEKDLKIKSAFIIGKNSSGIKFRLEDQYGIEMEALYFGAVEEFFKYIRTTYGQAEEEKLKTGRFPAFRLTITYFPKINEYNGFRSIQLMIQNYR